jgi:VWFA-related protein
MKMRCLLTAVLLLTWMIGALPAGAQGVVSLSIDADPTLDQLPRTQTLVTVRNENGVPISGLGPDKFEIVEDGRSSFPPSEVTAQVNSNAIVSIVMVIDISGSMKGTPIKEAMHAANALLDQLSPQDRVALIAFADNVDIDPAHLEEGKEVAFTTDKNAIRNVVNFLDEKIGWDTPLYDAIYKGVRMVSTEPVGKRAVVVMTDGRDERDNAQGVPVKDKGSLSAPDDPINEANRHNIPIFTIGLVGLGGKIDTQYLTRLAERTGGVYQQAPKPEELTPLFENVTNQLKQQYILTYDTGLVKDGNYHSLLVRVQLPQGQAFDEIKFQLSSDVVPPATEAPTEPAAPASPQPIATSGGVVALEQTATAGPAPTPVPTPTERPGIIGSVRKLVNENPLLAAVIGGGALLLIILIIALVIVLLRGRGGQEEEWGTGPIEAPYTPPPGWEASPPGRGTPVTAPPTERTEAATPGWVGSPLGTPVVGQPPGGLAAGPAIPQAGQTVVIERGPKHLSILVDKSRSDRKYDLKGLTHIGRGRDNHVVLDDPTVSRRHAWIKAEGEDFVIFDVGSANGTYVNDVRLENPQHLNNGDVVRFGDAEFVFTRLF